MSMRTTFTSNFINDGSEGYADRYSRMCDVLGIEILKDEYRSMIGQLSGILKGSDLSNEDAKRWIDEMSYELEKITKVEFTMVWLLEGQDIIIKHIHVLTKND